MSAKPTNTRLDETFGYKICILLSFMHDRATENKDFITRIMGVKKQIRIGDPVADADQFFISDILDDVIAIAEICRNHEDFGKFLYTHADLDAYFEYKKNNPSES